MGHNSPQSAQSGMYVKLAHQMNAASLLQERVSRQAVARFWRYWVEDPAPAAQELVALRDCPNSCSHAGTCVVVHLAEKEAVAVAADEGGIDIADGEYTSNGGVGGGIGFDMPGEVEAAAGGATAAAGGDHAGGTKAVRMCSCFPSLAVSVEVSTQIRDAVVTVLTRLCAW